MADNLMQMMPSVQVVETLTKAKHTLQAAEVTTLAPDQWLLIDATWSKKR
jgi:sarcosine oxidase gamma subunit